MKTARAPKSCSHLPPAEGFLFRFPSAVDGKPFAVISATCKRGNLTFTQFFWGHLIYILFGKRSHNLQLRENKQVWLWIYFSWPSSVWFQRLIFHIKMHLCSGGCWLTARSLAAASSGDSGEMTWQWRHFMETWSKYRPESNSRKQDRTT